MTTPVPTVEPPLAEPTAAPISEQEAVATVNEVLGGSVVEAGADEPGSPTHVGSPELADQAPVPTSSDAPTLVDMPEPESIPPAPAEVSGNGTITVACGDARYTGGSAAPGLNACGRKLVLDMQEDRVTGCSEPEGQIPDLIQIAGLKTRAFLCNACFAAHRNASKK